MSYGDVAMQYLTGIQTQRTLSVSERLIFPVALSFIIVKTESVPYYFYRISHPIPISLTTSKGTCKHNLYFPLSRVRRGTKILVP